MLSHPKARIGILKENPIHLEMVEAAEMLGVDFIVNVVLNSNREIAKAVSGDLKEAHLKGVRFLEDFSSVEIGQKGDIVITSSGHPLDLNFYQSVKSLVTAESFVSEGGEIILLAECSDGFGPSRFEECIMSSSSPDDLMEQIQKEYRGDIDHCLFLSRILKKCDVTIVTNNSAVQTINKKLIGTFGSMSDALSNALKRNGSEAKIIGLPYAQRVIPK
jgi:nickel-dependent lactate racemase